MYIRKVKIEYWKARNGNIMYNVRCLIWYSANNGRDCNAGAGARQPTRSFAGENVIVFAFVHGRTCDKMRI